MTVFVSRTAFFGMDFVYISVMGLNCTYDEILLEKIVAEAFYFLPIMLHSDHFTTISVSTRVVISRPSPFPAFHFFP
uniref:Uncharacterized protein n=1 Tax=Rhizophora mucronata TaxID=61149 RepID=A0A2P2NXE3_RHIMU